MKNVFVPAVVKGFCRKFFMKDKEFQSFFTFELRKVFFYFKVSKNFTLESRNSLVQVSIPENV